MKNVIVTFICILALFFNNHSLFAEQLITLFLKPYPVISDKEASEKLAPKFISWAKCSQRAQNISIPAPVSGIFATYGGFLTVSDLNGEISFPRKTY